ncbi:MAG: adenylosuccinate lyase [Flavobacteriaceae bacterium]
MNLNELTAVSPIDGRYRSKLKELAPYFSEFALIRYRVWVEVEYFIYLNETGLKPLSPLSAAQIDGLRALYLNFTEEDALEVKTIEQTTNHDVKAVEYFIKKHMDTLGLNSVKEFIHFGLTSQDINNTAIPLSLKQAIEQSILPAYRGLIEGLKARVEEWNDIPMLARTHGQPASPTRLGKEMEVFVVRLEEQLNSLQCQKFAGKFGGATGNFNAHAVAYPENDWKSFAKTFVEERLGLDYSFPTTQIEHYDHLASLFDGLKRLNTILIDFSRDVWAYVSLDYFKQKIKAGEVGSSAMPHKVNPIDFENAEGNLGVANALFEHLAAKLPVSRLQRDLTDSTVLRNIGVPTAHTLLSLKSIEKGLGKLLVNKEKISADLSNNWAVVAEAIQTVLRREGYPNPYEALKALTRTNEAITETSIADFITQLDVTDEVKAELRRITPFNYTGI